MRTDALDYLGKLLGRPVDADETVSLTSVQVGAAHAWLKRNGVAFDQTVLMRRSFQPRALLEGAAARPAAATAPAAPTAPGFAGGVGVDIEAVASLPETNDFRTEPFYAENFTPAEIAHCIGQADPRASLCGLWAAKEAVRKASAPVGWQPTLGDIEIGHDADGRPTHPGVQLSISHSAGFAVAMCVAQAPAAAPAAAAPAPTRVPAPAAAAAPRRSSRRLAPVAALAGAGAAVVLCVAVWQYAL